MNSKLVKKIICLLVIFALGLTTFTVIPIGIAEKDGTNTYKVRGTVYYDDDVLSFVVVKVATVCLYNIHTGESSIDVTDQDGFYLFTNVKPGHYQVYVKPPTSNYLTTNDSLVLIEVYEEAVDAHLRLDYIAPEPKSTFHGYLVDSDQNKISNGIVTLKSIDHPRYRITANTNVNDEFTLETFQGLYELWATAEGFQYNITTINLNRSSITNYAIMLSDHSESRISGKISYDTPPDVDKLRKELVLFNIDNDEILISSFNSTFFNLKAYHGNFTLIIDAPGYKAYYHSKIIELNATSTSYSLGEKILVLTNEETIKTSISFPTNDWNTIESNTVWTLNHDSYIYGLEYVDYGDDSITIGCPRFQVDMESGFRGSQDGIVGGIVESIEVELFEDWLAERGPYYLYTNDVFEVNSDHYGWKRSSFDVSTSGFTGTYDSTTPMKITNDLNYNHLPGDEPLNVTRYTIDFKKFRANQVFVLTLPNGYELSNVDNLNKDDKVWVLDYNKCQINSSVTIVAEKIIEPTAIITLRDKLGYIIEEDLFAVDVLEDLTFDAGASDSGSGVIENYTWELDDGTYRYGESITHNYTKAGKYNVTLSITTTAKQISMNYTIVYVDDTAPIARFIFQNETLVKLPEIDGIPQGEEETPTSYFNITFNATDSTDTFDSTESIEIWKYHWDFGDYKGGDTSNSMVTTWAYHRPGIYDVNLTVTDHAGHSDTLFRKININDLEAPTPKMITDPIGRTCEIDKKIWLNATFCKDNYDPIENLTIIWDLDTSIDSDHDGIFENDVDAIGVLVNFTAEYPGTLRPGPVHICLWVTDKASNIANTSDFNPLDWTIDVVGVDLRFAPVDELTDKFIEASKSRPKEGEKVWLTVNITNDGRVTAYDVLVSFFVNGKVTSTKIIDKIETGNFEVVKFTWKATGIGNHNISFNVSFENENEHNYEQLWYNNDRSQKMEVLEDPNKRSTDLMVAGIIAIFLIIIIVLVCVAILLRNRKKRYRPPAYPPQQYGNKY